MNSVEKVKIKFVDFYSPLYEEYIKEAISEVVDWEISDTPDFLFYGAGGTEHLKYNCVKVFWVSEELEPDFNICDYAISYTKIQFYDRVMHIPLWASPMFEDRMLLPLQKDEHEDDFYLNRPRFCNFIYSNGAGDPFRGKVFYALNQYKHVDSAGRYLNNMDDSAAAGQRSDDNYEASKIRFMRQYRFSIAMSNAQKFGHLDEKIFDAWAAGTVPIYWGDPLITDYFNPKSFIDCTDCLTAEEVVEKVRWYEEHPHALYVMQKEPIVQDKAYLVKYIADKQHELKTFLQHIVQQPVEKAKRRSKGFRMRLYERENRDMAALTGTRLYQLYFKFTDKNTGDA